MCTTISRFLRIISECISVESQWNHFNCEVLSNWDWCIQTHTCSTSLNKQVQVSLSPLLALPPEDKAYNTRWSQMKDLNPNSFKLLKVSSQNDRKLKISEKSLFYNCLNIIKSIGLLKILTCKTVSRHFFAFVICGVVFTVHNILSPWDLI